MVLSRSMALTGIFSGFFKDLSTGQENREQVKVCPYCECGIRIHESKGDKVLGRNAFEVS